MIRQALGEALAAAQEGLEEKNLRSDQIMVTQGDVVDCIVKKIRENEIDLVVMGISARTAGGGRFGQFSPAF